MPQYAKLTVDRFAESLSEGKYQSLTGARRAIGKSSGWSAKDKEKAQSLALAHFGEEGGSAAKPAKKTAAAKKAPKVAAVARKTPGKPGRKPGRKPSVGVASDDSGVQPRVARQPETHAVAGAGSLGEALSMGNELLRFSRSLREEVQEVKKAYPTSSNLTATQNQVSDRVNNLILQASELVASKLPALSPATRISVGDSTQGSGARPAAPQNGTLTEEESKTVEALQSVRPGSTIADLPRPSMS